MSLSLDESNSTMRDGCTEYLPIYAETTHDYIYASGKLLRETVTTTVEGVVAETTTLDFIYDQNGRPHSFTYNGTGYYYVLNLQGDVVRIVSNDGTTIQAYKYDAWGNSINTSLTEIGKVNPLRYRGYYYDSELEMYYLQSRYYDPSICRFVNADGYASTGQGFVGHNMFAYCLNNPVYYIDHTGKAATWSNVVYDRGGCGNRDDEPEPTIIADNEITKGLCMDVLYTRYDNWGANPPEEVIVECRKIDDGYTRTYAEDVADSFVESSAVGFITNAVATYLKIRYGIPTDSATAFLAGFGVSYLADLVSGPDAPIGVYDAYEITVYERYRVVDPYTGQTHGWQDYTENHTFVIALVEVALNQ